MPPAWRLRLIAARLRPLARAPAGTSVSSRCLPIASQSLTCARHFVLSYSAHSVLGTARLFDRSVDSAATPASACRA